MTLDDFKPGDVVMVNASVNHFEVDWLAKAGLTVVGLIGRVYEVGPLFIGVLVRVNGARMVALFEASELDKVTDDDLLVAVALAEA